MNEDIKRILDTLKEYYDGLGWLYSADDVLSPEDVKIIYNYIVKLQNNHNELKKWLIQLQKFKGINQQGFSWGVAQEVLDKMQELEER